MPDEAAKLQTMFDGYLQKPFHQQQLYRQLESLLGHATMKFTTPTPEAQKTQDYPKSVLESFDAETTAAWPGLAAQLKDWQEDPVTRFLDTFPMLEIASFGHQLHKEAARHDCPPLARYASALYTAAETFELDQVERLLREFPSFSRRITGIQASVHS